MTKEETASFIRAYLDGDTAVGNIIPIRDVLESAFTYLKEQPSLPANLDEAAETHRRKVFCGDPDYSQLLRETFKAGAEFMAGRYKFDYTKGHHTAMILSRECMNDHGWFQREREIIELTEFIEKICGYNQPTK